MELKRGGVHRSPNMPLTFETFIKRFEPFLLWSGVAWCGVAWVDGVLWWVWCSVVRWMWCGVVWCGWCGVMWMVLCGVMLCCVVWCGVVVCCSAVV